MPRKIQIKTITPIYDGTEDRIRLSINYQDVNNRIDLMLTRSMLLKLIPSIEEYIYKHYPDDYVEDEIEVFNNSNDDDINDENSKSKSSKQKSSNINKTKIDDLELYKKDEVLLYTVNLSFNKNTKSTLLKLISKTKDEAFLNCDLDLLKNVMNSIKKSAPKIAWGIGYL